MSNEHRHLNRIPRIERALIQVESGSHDGLVSGTTVSAQTCDVSVDGLKVRLSCPLIAGSVHQLCVSVTDHRKRYLLTSEVAWCCAEGDDYEAGLLIVASAESDFALWYDAFGGQGTKQST